MWATAHGKRPRMASSTSGAGNSDAIRYQNYLAQMERQQDAEIRDTEDQHKEKLTHLVGSHETQESEIKKDYNVQISGEAEALGHKLALTRERNDILISQERDKGEKEADRIRSQYQQKIESEKKVGDEQLSRMQDYYKKSAEELHRQYTKEQVRETQKGRQS
jgi:hypothetical protein